MNLVMSPIIFLTFLFIIYCPNTVCIPCNICVPTTVEFKKKIISLLQTLLFLPSESVLVQYWAAKEIGNTVVLTTTCQPFGLWGNNKELQSYHKGCSDHKLYVHPKEGVAFGLSGRVFLNRTHEQTRDVHRYPKYQRPPCEDYAIFTKIWGSFAVPVIEADKCVGVLEFVMDTPKDSSDITGAVYSALEATTKIEARSCVPDGGFGRRFKLLILIRRTAWTIFFCVFLDRPEIRSDPDPFQPELIPTSHFKPYMFDNGGGDEGDDDGVGVGDDGVGDGRQFIQCNETRCKKMLQDGEISENDFESLEFVTGRAKRSYLQKV
uniref:GAF domain-like protein n=1 Tax=Helianthus annuus TaxID=4232 RepID=A0A251RM14_HELAN